MSRVSDDNYIRSNLTYDSEVKSIIFSTIIFSDQIKKIKTICDEAKWLGLHNRQRTYWKVIHRKSKTMSFYLMLTMLLQLLWQPNWIFHQLNWLVEHMKSNSNIYAPKRTSSIHQCPAKCCSVYGMFWYQKELWIS